MNSRKKTGHQPCFFVAQISVSVLMSCRVVTKTDLGHVDSRVGSSLVYECTVKAAGLARLEGKEYIVEDGDIMYFKHNAKGGSSKKK